MGCRTIYRGLSSTLGGINGAQGSIVLLTTAGAISISAVGCTVSGNVARVNRGGIRRLLSGRSSMIPIRRRFVKRLRDGGIGSVISEMRLVRSISDVGLTGRVSGRTLGVNGIVSILLRIGVNRRRSG